MKWIFVWLIFSIDNQFWLKILCCCQFEILTKLNAFRLLNRELKQSFLYDQAWKCTYFKKPGFNYFPENWTIPHIINWGLSPIPIPSPSWYSIQVSKPQNQLCFMLCVNRARVQPLCTIWNKLSFFAHSEMWISDTSHLPPPL